MKKKIFTLLAIACAVCCALGFSACATNNTVEVTEITLDRTEVTLTEGEDVTLIATITPDNATDQSMEWRSSDTSVATVDSGSVVAIAEGEATISVVTHNDKSAACFVTVESKKEENISQHLVTYHLNGGKFENGIEFCTVQVDDGSKLPSGGKVIREGYDFTGWYKDEYRTELWDFDNDTVLEDTSVYAGWKYLNKYQPIIDALSNRIKTEHQDKSLNVEILSVFTDSDGKLCFIEKDGTGVFSYSTDINGFDDISEIPIAAFTQLKAYNDTYTSDNNSLIADYMPGKYTPIEDVVYSCVSEWEEDTEHYTTNGPWYSCKINSIIVDKNGKVYDYSVTVVTRVKSFNAVIGGNALSEDFDGVLTELGVPASDFYSERVKEKEA